MTSTQGAPGEWGPALVAGDEILPVQGNANVIGRQDHSGDIRPDIDLSGLPQAESVSRRHAELVFRDGRPLIQDLGSTNGTTLNGVSLTPNVLYPLREDDLIGLGNICAEFRTSCALPITPVEPDELSQRDASAAAGRAAPGTLVALFCDQCGEPQPSGARFCGACGSNLG